MATKIYGRFNVQRSNGLIPATSLQGYVKPLPLPPPNTPHGVAKIMHMPATARKIMAGIALARLPAK